MRHPRKPSVWVVEPGDDVAAEKEDVWDVFDSKPHIPSRETSENLLVYNARTAIAIFSAACDFCADDTKEGEIPPLTYYTEDAIRYLRALGRHGDVIAIVDRALSLRKYFQDGPYIRKLRHVRKRAIAALKSGKPGPSVPLQGVTSASAIASLGVPKSAVRILSGIGVNTIDDFLGRSFYSMARMNGVGRRSLEAVIDALARADIPYDEPKLLISSEKAEE